MSKTFSITKVISAAVAVFLSTALPTLAQDSSAAGIASASAAETQGATLRDLQDQVLGFSVGKQGSTDFVGVFSSGYLKRTEHDGYRSLNADHDDLGQFDAVEGSAFVSVAGNLANNFRAGAFIGGAKIDIEYGPFPINFFEAAGDIENEALIFGGFGLYTFQTSYVMVSAIGSVGETTLVDDPNFIPEPGTSNYDTRGGTVSLVAGNVFPLSGGLKADVRGGISYTHYEGDSFIDPTDEQLLKGEYEGANAQGSLTLFKEFNAGSGVFRPYAKGEVRVDIDVENEVHNTIVANGVPIGVEFLYEFGQDRTLGLGELGFDYKVNNMTFGAAVYGEVAGDREAIGGRLGAKIDLN